MSLPVSVAAALVGFSMHSQPPTVIAPADAIARAVDWVLVQDAVPLGLVQEQWEVGLTAEEEQALSDEEMAVEEPSPPVEPVEAVSPGNYWVYAAELITKLQREAAELLERIAAVQRAPEMEGPVAEDFACVEACHVEVTAVEFSPIDPGEPDLSDAEMELLAN